MAAVSPETAARIQSWRARLRSGEVVPDEEMREALRLLRGDRMAAAAPTAGSRTTKSRSTTKSKPNADDLLAGLEDL